MPIYSSNDILDILLILGECHIIASRLYRERLFDWNYHPTHWIIRLIEIRVRRHIVRRIKPRRNLTQDDDPQVLTVLGIVAINHHISLRKIERTSGILRSRVQGF